MKMSDVIADFIGEMLSDGGGVAELQRTLLEAARGIGGRLSQNDAARLTRALVSAELLTQREGQLLLSACSDGALAEVDKTDRDRLRAAIYRCAVMGVATV